MSSKKITSLDRRLYAWLGESDDKKFERAFNAYFSVAFPAVVRYLMRISRWDPTQLEELAQDALLRFFDRVGRSPRDAAGAIKQALSRVRPMNLGPFHQRQVNLWARDVSSFRDSAMRFRLPQTDEPDDGIWKAAIHAIADRISVLRQQGCQILNALRAELSWEFGDDPPARITPVDSDEHTPGNIDEKIDNDGAEPYGAAKAFADAITSEAALHSSRAQTALKNHPRLVEFVQGTLTIVCSLPRLRIPTNGYLFEIALTIYLDECKKRGRQKRGGSPRISSHTTTTERADLLAQHPFEVLHLDPANGLEAEEYFEDAAPTTANDKSASRYTTAAIDPTIEYENEELFEKFFEYLRKPVADAAEACANAVGTRRAAAERHRLESFSNKFTRTTAVLRLMGEGHTQEQIAEQLGISRNQVKYTIELVQEAYARFTADSTRPAPLALNLRGQSNVQ